MVSRLVSAGWLTVLIGLAWVSVPAMGQEDGQPAADPLDELRRLVAFTTAHDTALDDWIRGQVDQFKAAVENDPAAATAFLDTFVGQFENPANTAQFEIRFAERVGAALAGELSRSEPLSPQAAWPMARILFEIDKPEMRAALDAGLKHPVPAVRYLCARSYARLQRELSTDARLVRGVIERLRDAGVVEQSSVVLGAILKALAFDDAEFLPDVAQACSAIFATRVQKRQAGEAVLADRAEIEAWEYFYAKRARLAEADKALLVRQLAGFLVLDTDRYPAAKSEEKRVIEERIEVCETLLEALAGNGGDVRGAMKKGGDTVDLDMKLELLKWVGSEAGPGSLNSGPWNVPTGGLPAAT